MAVLALGGLPGLAPAQAVQGRVLELPGEDPIAGALVALVDSAGTEVTRGATSPSGGFVLQARAAGRYHVLIRRIGQYPWRSLHVRASRMRNPIRSHAFRSGPITPETVDQPC